MCGIEVSSFGQGSDLLSLHQEEEEVWPEWWVGSSLCTWDALCPDFCDKCHRWPRCQAWQLHRCVRGGNEWTGRCCRAPPQRRTLGGLGKCTWRAWISCRSPQTASQAATILDRSRCRHQPHGRLGTLEGPCSYLPASGFGRGTNRQSPFQLHQATITDHYQHWYMRDSLRFIAEINWIKNLIYPSPSQEFHIPV